MMWPIIESSVPNKKRELGRWAQSRALPAVDVFRASLILALAEWLSYQEIERNGRPGRPRAKKTRMATRLGAGSAPQVRIHLRQTTLMAHQVEIRFAKIERDGTAY